ncbi:MAG: hypothetical protein AMJ88_02510 [Anaerolineae bacterium SM23_ 63]|nr:MAG: hypothetical protein AMJ88_02510 [Anaerolineae bacterium SM23_ 63]
MLRTNVRHSPNPIDMRKRTEQKPFVLNVILRSAATKNLVVGTEDHMDSENEILRGAKGPEHCRGAQDDINVSVIPSALRREESL